MSLKVGIQMDHVSTIRIEGDTSFALCLEAQARGFELFHFTADRLRQEGDVVSAAVESLEVRDVEGDHFTLGEAIPKRLDELDVVLMRQDPPFDMAYVSATHMLERIHPSTLVINDPASVRNAPEKILVTRFSEWMPETLITRDLAAIHEFRRRCGDVIVKPLYASGGAGVFQIGESDRNMASLLEMMLSMSREPLIVQRYLPEVRDGDKRILLVEGEPVGAVNRVPAEGDARSNMHVGGKAEPVEITEREREICSALRPMLRERNLLFAGVDVIGGMLTEINVTSPTGIREVLRFGGADVAALFWDAVQRRLKRDSRA